MSEDTDLNRDVVLDRLLREEKIIRLSDVLKFQNDAMWRTMKWNENGCFPDDSPIWKVSETDSPEERSEFIKSCEEDDELAKHRFLLSRVRIDATMVKLRLDEESGEPEVIEYLKKDFESRFPFEPIFYLLGEIPTQAGHVSVSREDGKVFPCVHDWNFYIMPPGED
jgi:hypothetical protein